MPVFVVHGVPGGPREVPEGSPGGPRGVPGKPQGPGEDLFGHWGPFRGPVAIFVSSLKMFKNGQKSLKDINTMSKPVQNLYVGVQNHDFWFRNRGSNGDPWGISVGSCGKRSARDSERVVSSIYIYT